MMLFVNIISFILISAGCGVMAIAALGLYRFPDVYMRLHSSTKINTGGAMSIFIGLMLRTGLHLSTVKIFVLMILIFILTPVVSHAIARSVHLQGKIPLIPFLSHSTERKTNKDKRRKK